MIGKVARFAGPKVASLFKVPGTDKYLSKTDMLARFAPDMLFGGLEAAMTPGDAADKAIAGTFSAVPSALAGLALGRLGGRNQGLSTALDMVGSIGGDMGGRMVGEQLQRGKDKVMGGKGQTAYERLSEEDQQRLEKLIREDQTGQVLAQLGLLPASTQSAMYSAPDYDYTTGMGVS
jgi:hypothetical protein